MCIVWAHVCVDACVVRVCVWVHVSVCWRECVRVLVCVWERVLALVWAYVGACVAPL